MIRKMQAARGVTGGRAKTAGLFVSGGLGSADIADSENIGQYNFEFPVDSLELPQSRHEELKFYRIAYDRDPIVGRAIDLHTELPMAKLTLEKPKCSSEEYADFIYDYYWQFISETRLFEMLLHATREYWLIGEGFIFVEDTEDVPLCEVAQEQLEDRSPGGKPISESYNAPEGADELSMVEWLSPQFRSSAAKIRREARRLGITLPREADLETEIKVKTATLTRKRAKLASIINKYADDPPPTDAAGLPLESPLKRLKEQRDAEEDSDNLLSETDLDTEEPGLDDASFFDEGPEGGVPELDEEGEEDEETEVVDERQSQLEMQKQRVETLQRYLELLNKKKELLEELKIIREKREAEYELFAHVVNKDYRGCSEIKLIPPDNIEIRRDARFGSTPTIFYKPSPQQKQAYLDDDNLADDMKDMLMAEGVIPLNQDPLKGSFVIHFARRKAPFEDHGRSILQRCLRTIIYRDKLRQVQVTLASRNMTPKTVIIAPDIPPAEVAALRAHVDEAKADPDYTIVLNYDAQWNEIGSEGRLLSLDSEWQHTNSDLATGLGFTPELLIGEGFYSGNRIHLELMNSTYLLYRDLISEMVENFIFKPIAMKKGFYEIDKYGRPRWIYPKLNFSRLALRDSGDVYEMMYNLYNKGSLPVSIIYEFMNLDSETCRRQLEADLFTVNDSKFNQLLDAVYSGLVDTLLESTDLRDRVATGLGLKEKTQQEAGIEGSGEGMGGAPTGASGAV
jgi:hypothetical protein